MSRRDFLRLPQLFRDQAVERLKDPPPPPQPAPFPHDSRGLVDVGSPHDLRELVDGAVVTSYAAQGRFYLVRTSDGVLAVARVCRSPGCAVLWQENAAATPSDEARGWPRGRFFCLQHRAAYDRYGEPASEAQGALDRYTVLTMDGRVLVDTASPLARVTPEGGGRPAFPLA